MALVSPEDPHRKLIGSRAVLTSASPRRNLDSRLSAGSAGRADNQGSDNGCRWEEIRFDVTSSPSNAFQRQTAGVYHSAPFPEATAAAKRRGASSCPMLPVDLPRLSLDAGAKSADVTRGLDPSSADNTASITTSDEDYRDGGDGAGAGGSETSAISDRERLFLQQLRRSSIATRERILTNVADVWISHQESESWLGQLEKLAAAQQSGGKHVHVTTRYGQQQHATRTTAAGTFRSASQSMAERQQQPTGDPPQLAEIQAAHQPRGVRKLRRNGESAKSAQFEYSPQQPLSPPAGEQRVGAHAQLFERTSTAPSGTTSTTIVTSITSSNNSVGSGSGSGSGGSRGRATAVSGALSRKSWLFGFSSRSTQERSTSRLGASPHGGSS
ncbi:unnamed protein product [Closterium sp. NIES-54]